MWYMWSYRIYVPERRIPLRMIKDKCEHKSLDYTTHNRKLEYECRIKDKKKIRSTAQDNSGFNEFRHNITKKSDGG